MLKDDTIASIATPIGTGGISVIRISGDDSIIIADKIFVSKSKKPLFDLKSHRVVFGDIIDKKQNKIVDEVLVTVFKKPSSYTGEDTVEISCHGGVLVTNLILRLILENGAKMAMPGEFSKRAFLNGKMDLSKAEAVINLINSKTDMAVYSNAFEMSGKVSEKIYKARDELLFLSAKILAKVDFPEEDIDEIFENDVLNELEKINDELLRLVESFETGRILKEGVSTLIIGKPNVGKSSLLNNLLSEERAIVTEIAGTTRDTIEEYINIKGIPVKLIDTAGIRQTEDVIEKIGVLKSISLIENADLIIFMINAQSGIDEQDIEIIDKIKNKKVIVLVNKVDLQKSFNDNYLTENLKNAKIIYSSMITKEGIKSLENAISEMFLKGDVKAGEDAIISNERHRDSLKKAQMHILNAKNEITNKMPLDIVTIDISLSIEALGEACGQTVSEEIVDKIFSQFCLGK